MNKLSALRLAAAFALALIPLRAPAQQPPVRRAARPAARPAAAPAPAASPAASSEGSSAAPAPVGGPDRVGLPATDPADAPDPVTVIDAYERTTFASKERVAVFRGKVKVVDPRFQLVCDELTVFLNKSSQPAPGAAPAPHAAADPAPPAGEKPSGGGIDHAVAKGHVVILQHRAATAQGGEEKISIGRGDEGTFDNKTGDMTLKGTPSIEQNGSTHVAVSPDTVMIIHRDGGLDTEGPAQTILKQRKGSDAFDLPGGPAAPGSGKKKDKGAANPAPGGKRAPRPPTP